MFRDPGFPLFEARDSGFKAKSGQDWGLTVCPRGGMSKITIGITELHEILGRDYGIEEYYWGSLVERGYLLTSRRRIEFSTLQLLVRSNGKTAYHRFSAELSKESSTRTESLIIS